MWFEFDKKKEGNDYFILIDNVTIIISKWVK